MPRYSNFSRLIVVHFWMRRWYFGTLCTKRLNFGTLKSRHSNNNSNAWMRTLSFRSRVSSLFILGAEISSLLTQFAEISALFEPRSYVSAGLIRDDLILGYFARPGSTAWDRTPAVARGRLQRRLYWRVIHRIKPQELWGATEYLYYGGVPR